MICCASLLRLSLGNAARDRARALQHGDGGRQRRAHCQHRQPDHHHHGLIGARQFDQQQNARRQQRIGRDDQSGDALLLCVEPGAGDGFALRRRARGSGRGPRPLPGAGRFGAFRAGPLPREGVVMVLGEDKIYL